MSDKILEVRHLTKSYKDFALKDINLSLDKGYILGLIGRNGAGKTTLINCILGTSAYQEGMLEIDGVSAQTHSYQARGELGFIIDPAPFMKKKTVVENGALFGAMYQNWDAALFHKLLERMEVPQSLCFQKLSKGAQAKFQLAFALAHHPKLLIMDEPTSGLDPVFRREFLRILQEAVRDYMVSAIISTHLTSDLDKVADYIYLLSDGQMVFDLDKESLADTYPLIQGRYEQLALLPAQVRGRVRRAGGSFSTILKEPNYLAEHPELYQELQIERTTIENLMYYLSAPELSLGEVVS